MRSGGGLTALQAVGNLRPQGGRRLVVSELSLASRRNLAGVPVSCWQRVGYGAGLLEWQP